MDWKLEDILAENFADEEILCRFLVRGKKKTYYILCKTSSGIRFIPYTITKELIFSADFENSIFFADEDIKKVWLIKSDLIYKIKIQLKDGKTYRFKALRKSKLDDSHKENIKKFKNIYKKTSRKAQNLERLEIVISLILAVIIGSHAFIYSFTHSAAKNIDGNELIEYAKSEGQDFMFEAPEMYNKSDLKLSGKTQKYENEYYSISFPANLKFVKDLDNSEATFYRTEDERIAVLLDKSATNMDLDKHIDTPRERIKNYIFKVATYGKCKKYFGIVPDSYYNYNKIASLINLNELDVNDNDMCYVYSIFGTTKSVASAGDGVKYIVENDNQCGFISDYNFESNETTQYNLYYQVCSADNLDYLCTVSVILRDYTEEDIETAYAIINSIEMK